MRKIFLRRMRRGFFGARNLDSINGNSYASPVFHARSILSAGGRLQSRGFSAN